MSDSDTIVQFPSKQRLHDRITETANRIVDAMPPVKRAESLLAVIGNEASWLRLGLETVGEAKAQLEETMEELNQRERQKVIDGASPDAAFALALLVAMDRIDEHSFELALGGVAQAG